MADEFVDKGPARAIVTLTSRGAATCCPDETLQVFLVLADWLQSSFAKSVAQVEENTLSSDGSSEGNCSGDTSL